MKPTQVLMSEHRVIEQVLDCLEVMTDRCNTEQGLETDRARQAIDFFRNFADRCHHGKEEDCLFPLLEARGFSRETGPTGVMLHEHDDGRQLVRGMMTAVEAYEQGDLGGLTHFVANAQAFIELLRQHIQKEDHCMFAMADQALSADDQQKLAESFENVEHHDMGEGAHEKYLAIANELADHFGVARAEIDPGRTGCCGHH